VIRVALDDEAGVPQDVRELQTEIAIGEVDKIQAARS
jgi:hypothetical protein